jgi:hypothetical protein
VLQYLVTSKTRRRLLTLLWGEGRRGSASQLAELAGVRFAGAYRELRAMLRHQLVTSGHEDGAEVYSANQDHPDADVLRRLVTARPTAAPPQGKEAESVRADLRALGAPLSGPAAKRLPADREAALVAGVKLARRDPVVARALPLCLWRQRGALDPERLVTTARKQGEKHALGFLLDLTTLLSGDPRFARWSRGLKDRRVRTRSDFFHLPTTAASSERARRNKFPVAHRWGFTITADLDSFRSLFDKFAHVRA